MDNRSKRKRRSKNYTPAQHSSSVPQLLSAFQPFPKAEKQKHYLDVIWERITKICAGVAAIAALVKQIISCF